MTVAALLSTLDRWRDAGWLRGLDVALARFVADTDPAAPASLVLATALVAQLEGRGHSALPLDSPGGAPLDDALRVLDWPAQAQAELQAALADWPGDAAALRAVWQGASVVEIEPAEATGHSPLVLSGGLLYLRRYWRHETRVAAQIRWRSNAVGDAAGGGVDAAAASGRSAVDPTAARALIDQLFGPAATNGEPDWQAVACAVALRGRLTVITGGPGTGKTHTAARLLVLLQALHTGDSPLRVALAAPTGKAATRLRQSLGKALQGLGQPLATALGVDRWVGTLGPARTLHSLLGVQSRTRRFRHDAAHPLDVDLLLVDEASMVHLEMMAQLLEALPRGARVVLLGDKDQLASVEAGAVMGDLCHGAGEGGAVAGYRPATVVWVRELTGCEMPAAEQGHGPALAQQTVMLRKSRRFDGPIGALAAAVNRGDAAAALAALRNAPQGPVAVVEPRDPAAVLPLLLEGRAGAAAALGYRAYVQSLATRPSAAATDHAAFDAWARSVLQAFDASRVLCAVRDGPWGVTGLNQAIEHALADVGLPSRRGEWYEGRPVMVTRNDPSLGVFNGDIGVVLRAPATTAGEGGLRACFLDGDTLRSVAVSRLADVETAFAMTVHKSQGSEFGHVVLVLPDEDVPVLTRELVYTGITRASLAFTLVARHPGLLSAAVGRLTRRVSGLRQLL